MIQRRNKLSPFEVAVYELLETARTFSTCEDKQVAALCANGTDILSVAWNKPNHLCKMNCDAVDKVCATHAEIVLTVTAGSTVYLSLFPCVPCQMSLFSRGVKYIYVFGEQHKDDCGLLQITLLPNMAKVLTDFNGKDHQLSVIMGEMAELTVELCNSQRKDTRTTNITDELIDVELQMHCLRALDSTAEGHDCKTKKYNQLITKYYKEIV